MYKKYQLIILTLVLFPSFVLAVDLNQGLLENQDNWVNRGKFLSNGAQLEITPPEQYPISSFNRITVRSSRFSLRTDKEIYSAGDTINLHISAENKGYVSRAVIEQYAGMDRFYIWSNGNYFVEIYRLSDEVKEGEFLVAVGTAYSKDDISLFQNEKKEFDFSWQVPDNVKPGHYEIRIFPASKGMLFLGYPAGYSALLKASVTIENKAEKVEKAGWELSKLKLGEDAIKLKEKIIRLNAVGNYKVTVPLVNKSNSSKDVTVTKQFRSTLRDYGRVLSEESESITLGPNEEKVISYSFDETIIKQIPSAVISISFGNKGNKNLLAGRDYLKFPVANIEGEGLEIPVYFIGNQGVGIWGLGLTTVEKESIFKPNSYVTFFIEVVRADRLYYETAERERAKEDNIKIDLKLLDKNGNNIDKAGYAGPSWDRSGLIYKTIKLSKKYDYLKLVGILSTHDRGEVERKEIEYFAPEEAKKDNIDKFVEILENNLSLLIATAGTIILFLVILVLFLRMRRDNKKQ